MRNPQSDSPGSDARGDDDRAASRRVFLLMSLGVLATGCSTAKDGKNLGGMPGPVWGEHAGSLPRTEPSIDAAPTETGHLVELPRGVLPRSMWSSGQPVPRLMNRMIPIRYITVHHDGMDPFYGDTQAAAAERIELIRRAHRNKRWGDIGYHFVVDRGGRVWEGRPLRYQGAHVRDHNEGNIGVMCLGNFDQQAPTVAQLDGLGRHLTRMMGKYRVSTRNVRTHQEWAATVCPGRNLQRHMNTVRSRHAIG